MYIPELEKNINIYRIIIPDFTQTIKSYLTWEQDLGTINGPDEKDFDLEFASGKKIHHIIITSSDAGNFTASIYERSVKDISDRIWEDDSEGTQTAPTGGKPLNEPISYIDLDGTNKLHLKIVNNHSNVLGFKIKIKYE